MRIWTIGLALAVALLPAAAQAMTVATFLSKADTLKSRGLLAIGSPDIKLLQDEMKQVSTAYRDRLVADRTAGRPPHSCPPPKGKAKLNSDELLAYLRTIPAAQRETMSMQTAFFALMAQRYPCRAG